LIHLINEYRILIHPDKLPTKIRGQVSGMMFQFAQLQTCRAYQLVPEYFQIDLIIKKKAEKIYNELVVLIQENYV